MTDEVLFSLVQWLQWSADRLPHTVTMTVDIHLVVFLACLLALIRID